MPYYHFTPKEQYVIAHMTSAGFSQETKGGDRAKIRPA